MDTIAAVRCEVVPARIEHVYALAATLRDDDRDEIEAAGLDVRRTLRESFRDSILRYTALVDGEIAAMWGLGGSMIAEVGYPWLLTAPPSERLPQTYVKLAARNVAMMQSYRPRLENHVAARYQRAIRFVKLLGFTVEPAAPYGAKGALFHRFWKGSPAHVMPGVN